jgi:hypothetical protein
MEDKIDLADIMDKVDRDFAQRYPTMAMTPGQYREACMKEAIHQALVLASEKATTMDEYGGNTGSQYYDSVVDKQSILDIEKLIV